MDKDDFCKKGQLDIFVKVTSTWFVSMYILLAYIVGIYIFQPDLLAYRFRSHRPRPSICEPGCQKENCDYITPLQIVFCVCLSANVNL